MERISHIHAFNSHNIWLYVKSLLTLPKVISFRQVFLSSLPQEMFTAGIAVGAQISHRLNPFSGQTFEQLHKKI